MEKFSKQKRFGRLIAFDYTFGLPNRTKIHVLCDCGNRKIVRQGSLERGTTKSCGCLHRENVSKRFKRHGMSGTRVHNIWIGMMERCHNPKKATYHGYGSRGISVSKNWHIFKTFCRWAVKNGYEDTLTIERIDVNGNYEPQNCKWIPRNEQQKNTRRTITYKGETAREASLRLSNTETLVWQRVKALGWSLEKAFTRPSSRKKLIKN